MVDPDLVRYTYVHLLISVAIAPLLLLRSTESVDSGVDDFKNYLKHSPTKQLQYTWSVLGVAAHAIAAFFFCHRLSELRLTGIEGRGLYWRAFMIGLLGWNLALAAVGYQENPPYVTTIIAIGAAAVAAIASTADVLVALAIILTLTAPVVLAKYKSFWTGS